MFQMVVYEMYSEREKLIGITKNAGFSEVINRLEELKSFYDSACILVRSFDTLIWLFKNMQLIEGSSVGNAVYINDSTKFCESVNTYPGRNVSSVYEAWLNILRDLNEDIDELFRYSKTDKNEDVNFLKNLLMFLSYIYIYEDEKLFTSQCVW